jgi:DNA uptake protein ComE-like DNA-binding protein
LPGIGDVLSKRIVKFRNSIHGFKSIDDIKKTYGLSDSTFQIILPYLTISGDK